ncbi:MAG: hypothetical protein HQL39_03665 [Alphaproteobacteria bacterium]|nr:hypothetical protein [Alphaproteobacteria bacterium]
MKFPVIAHPDRLIGRRLGLCNDFGQDDTGFLLRRRTPPLDLTALSSSEKDTLIGALMARLDALEARGSALEAENAALKAQNAALRDKLILQPKAPDNSRRRTVPPRQGLCTKAQALAAAEMAVRLLDHHGLSEADITSVAAFPRLQDPRAGLEATPYGVMPAANRCKRRPSAWASASNWFQSSGG